MGIFKKKKPLDVKDILQPLNFDAPEIIKVSKIKPTRCARCFSIYQAKHEHFKFERDMGYITNKSIIYTECPVCKNFNKVEFEYDNDEIMPPCKVGDLIYMPWEWDGRKGISCLKVTTLTNILDFGWDCGTDFNTDDEEYAETYNYGRFTVDDIGKTVFLTREEAEQALKERRGV